MPRFSLILCLLSGFAIGCSSTGEGVRTGDNKTAAESEIDAASLARNEGLTIEDMLRRVSGVRVTNGRVEIRGVNSISGDTQPLFVVDTVPVGNSLQSLTGINPNDVSRIRVLKGASAAMYGSRGSNGVILIELKR
ncbi:MAG: TonB-dependent receptor plug domain-containing protein [Bacteroidota bacterium]